MCDSEPVRWVRTGKLINVLTRNIELKVLYESCAWANGDGREELAQRYALTIDAQLDEWNDLVHNRWRDLEEGQCELRVQFMKGSPADDDTAGGRRG